MLLKLIAFTDELKSKVQRYNEKPETNQYEYGVVKSYDFTAILKDMGMDSDFKLKQLNKVRNQLMHQDSDQKCEL